MYIYIYTHIHTGFGQLCSALPGGGGPADRWVHSLRAPGNIYIYIYIYIYICIHMCIMYTYIYIYIHTYSHIKRRPGVSASRPGRMGDETLTERVLTGTGARIEAPFPRTSSRLEAMEALTHWAFG